MPLQTTPVVGLPADRLYDWNPGLDSVGGDPDRTTVFTTVYPGGDIQAAIDACPAGEVVQLAAGTFTVNNYLLIDKGITLRGAVDPVTNAPLTVLQKTNGATPGSYTAPDYNPIIIVGPNRFPNQTGTSTNLTSDAVADTYSITLASTAGLSPGQFVLLDEDDYTSASFIPLPNRNGSPTSAEILASDRAVFMDHSPSDPGDDPFPDSLTWFSPMGRPLNELKEIASISGNTVTFTSPITITYTVSKTAQLTSFDDTFVKYAGIENLSLKGGSDGNVRFEAAAYSWMKNCEDTGWLGEGVAIDSSFRIEVRDSYIHGGAWPEPGGGGYAIGLDWGSAEALIENNIILRANKMMVGKSAGAGTVVAYNYTDDGFILTDPSWQEVGISGSHMVGSHSWLFEGNESFNYDSDNTHGNAIYMTVFRNNLTGDRTDFPSEANARAVGLMFGSWWQSIIGNVLGIPGEMAGWTYQSPGLGNQWGGDNIWEIGYDPQHWEQDADPKAISTLIRGGNYDYLTNSIHWENIPSQTLPNSLYLSSKPAFFGSYTWPWVDPTGSTQLYILPAKARYDAGTPFLLPDTAADVLVAPVWNFDGINRSDFLWQHTSGQAAVWLLNGTSLISGAAVGPNVGPSWHLIGDGDFNADGRSDFLWQNDSGLPAIWTMDGTTVTGGAALPDPGPTWHVKAAGDFNGDGKSDILWQNDSGLPAIWTMDGTTVTGGAALPDPGPTWHVKAARDFNGDHLSDILWQNDNGLPAIWTMDGTTVTGGAALPDPGPTWHVKAAGDFNGDGKSDILWQNDSGLPAIWTMDGTTVTGGAALPDPGPTWHVKAAGDFNGDHLSDILWQNDNGQAAIWLMNGTNVIGGDTVGPNPGPSWHVVGAGQFNNGDTKSDILWQNDNGQAAVWLLDGTSVIGGSLVGSNPGADWHLIA
jgi:hypothetical protein